MFRCCSPCCPGERPTRKFRTRLFLKKYLRFRARTFRSTSASISADAARCHVLAQSCFTIQNLGYHILNCESGCEGEAGSSWSRAGGTTSTAEVAAAAESVAETRPRLFSQRTEPRQKTNSQCLLVQLGLLGPGSKTRPSISAAVNVLRCKCVSCMMSTRIVSEATPCDVLELRPSRK